jgi:endonuclease-3
MDVQELIRRLKKRYPVNFFYRSRDPFYVLVSTVLSQRTRDEVTYPASGRLFERFDSPETMALADVNEIEDLVKEVGFYRVKAQRIRQISQILLDEYGGTVPDDMNDLLKLPGVGRKTANCVLAYAYSKDAIAVDTHVHRISNRLGLVNTKTPEQTEDALKMHIQQDMWKDINELFVKFGQDICRPVSPKCDICILDDMCPKII